MARAKALAFALGASLLSAWFAAAGALGAATSVARSIVLPPTLVAEAPATLAVLDATGRLVPGVDVTLSDGRVVKTDATGRARLVVPAQLAELQARIAGGPIVATSPIVKRPASTDAVIQLTDFPAVIDVQDQFAISGARFEGDADENHVWLGGKQALVLAASPASLAVLPSPDTPLGTSQLRVEGNGSPARSVDITVVEIDAINPPGPLRIGQPATLIVRVRGTAQPLDVELGNWSPSVIKMLGQTTDGAAPSDPNIRRVRTSGGEKNQAQIQIEPLAQGKFYVRARLAHERP